MKQATTAPAWTRVSEIELVYKSKMRMSERPVLTTSLTAYELLLSIWNTHTLELQEEFKVLVLNCANRVLGLYHASTGGKKDTCVDIGLIMIAALKAGAYGIILCHNHPSGRSLPSEADHKITDRIKQAATYLNIKLLDHLIITAEEYYSFADQGLV